MCAERLHLLAGEETGPHAAGIALGRRDVRLRPELPGTHREREALGEQRQLDADAGDGRALRLPREDVLIEAVTRNRHSLPRLAEVISEVPKGVGKR